MSWVDEELADSCKSDHDRWLEYIELADKLRNRIKHLSMKLETAIDALEFYTNIVGLCHDDGRVARYALKQIKQYD